MTMDQLVHLARRYAAWVLGPLMAAGAALWARHAWVQAQGMEAWCGIHPSMYPCPWRDLVIQAFIHHRLSSAALLLGAAAWALMAAWRLSPISKRARTPFIRSGSLACAWLGLVLSIFGLTLYDADRSAFAALLCALAASQTARDDESAWATESR